MSSTQSIRELTEPLLAGAGLELWDVEIGRGIVRILIDRDGGVDLEALTRASQVLSGVFDDHPEAAPEGAYQLEVSSPGVERTLRSVAQYRRYVGEPVSIKLTAPMDGQRRWRGKLVTADDDGVTIAAEDGAETVHFPYEKIERTRTVLVWGPQSKGSQSKAGGSARRTDPRRQGRAGRSSEQYGGRSGTEVKETS